MCFVFAYLINEEDTKKLGGNFMTPHNMSKMIFKR